MIAERERKVGQLTMEVDLLKMGRSWYPAQRRKLLCSERRPQAVSVARGMPDYEAGALNLLPTTRKRLRVKTLIMQSIFRQLVRRTGHDSRQIALSALEPGSRPTWLGEYS
jgi:hypothetical protein